jgi:hypothetical protein
MDNDYLEKQNNFCDDNDVIFVKKSYKFKQNVEDKDCSDTLFNEKDIPTKIFDRKSKRIS